MSVQRRLLAFAGLVLATALVLGSATAATAAPAEPTLGLAALKTLLNNSPSGEIDGYFKTVVKGQTITTIDVKILAVTAGARAGSSLILFDSDDPLIVKYGGIVAGMSGSPIYVNDGSGDKIIGAVSYGDWFTLGGTGLATPIDSMLAMKNLAAPNVIPLDHTVLSSGKLIDRVIVSDDPESFKGAEDDGALVAKPLSSVYIGGLNPSGHAYKALQATLAKHNITAVKLDTPLAGLPGDSESNLATDLVSGASVAALASRGDLWVGGLGTVTYNDNGTVFAFGHPAFWAGETSLYMTNAWIDGVWPSTYDPYKLGSPTATRGQFTQDRYAGIMGQVDSFPKETTITAHAVNTDTGEATSTQVYLPRMLLNTEQWDSYLAAAAVDVVAEKLVDVGELSGSAQTTTTVVVNDGTQDHTIVLTNLFDSPYLSWDVSEDVYTIIDELQYYVIENGTQDVDIKSIDFQMSYTQARRSATIAGVKASGPLKTGENTATITYVAVGQPDYVTRDVTFTIPAGMSLSGELSASSSDDYYWEDEFEDLYYDESDYYSEESTPGPISNWIETVADAAQYLKQIQPYNVVKIAYEPYTSKSPTSSVTSASVPTDWYLSGSAYIESPRIFPYSRPTKIDYRGSAQLYGAIVSGVTTNTPVQIWASIAGEPTERLIKTVTAKYYKSSGYAFFDTSVKNLPANTSLRMHLEPREGWLSADRVRKIKVRAKTAFSASATKVKPGKTITLSASVMPTATAGSQVTFEYLSPMTGDWTGLSTQTLVDSGTAARASTTWKPSRGTHLVRYRFLGGPSNIATTSKMLVIRVKK